MTPDVTPVVIRDGGDWVVSAVSTSATETVDKLFDIVVVALVTDMSTVDVKFAVVASLAVVTGVDVVESGPAAVVAVVVLVTS